MPKGIPKNGINKGQFKRGVLVSPETTFKKGQKPWNTGKKWSEEMKNKLSEAHKGLQNPNKGKKFPFKERPNAKGRTVWNKGIKVPQIAGANSPMWKGGVTPKHEAIRHSLESVLWRKACFERDNFTCAKYGVRTGGLLVHHINNFAEFPELRFAIDNGITLSEKAHKEFHKKYGFRNNTREQLEEFLNNK
jgi:hypothetical protein